MSDDKKRPAWEEALGNPTVHRYVPPDKAGLIRIYDRDAEIRQTALFNSIPFVSEKECPYYKLAQGLILVGALSGRSKTTTGANIVTGFLGATDRKAVVINNEELSADTYDRVACLRNGSDFFRFRRRLLPQKEMAEVEETRDGLFDRLIVAAGDGHYDMTCVEHVCAVLDYAASVKDVGLVVLDYYQTVTHSLDSTELDAVHALKKLGDYLREYGRKSSVPVVVLAQLKPASEGVPFQSRTQNDNTIFNHAMSAIEIDPNFTTGITTFRFHKDRIFQQTGKEFQMKYHNGAYMSVTEEVPNAETDWDV